MKHVLLLIAIVLAQPVQAGFFDIFEDIKDAVNEATDYVGDGFVKLGDAFKDAAEDSWDKPYHNFVQDYDDPAFNETLRE